MPATIQCTSIGVIVNGTLSLTDQPQLFDILDNEPDFPERLRTAIANHFEAAAAESAEMFRLNGSSRPEVVFAYSHQMQLLTNLLTIAYPQYQQALQQINN